MGSQGSQSQKSKPSPQQSYWADVISSYLMGPQYQGGSEYRYPTPGMGGGGGNVPTSPGFSPQPGGRYIPAGPGDLRGLYSMGRSGGGEYAQTQGPSSLGGTSTGAGNIPGSIFPSYGSIMNVPTRNVPSYNFGDWGNVPGFFDKNNIDPLLAQSRLQLNKNLDTATGRLGGSGLISSSGVLDARNQAATQAWADLQAQLYPMRQQEFGRQRDIEEARKYAQLGEFGQQRMLGMDEFNKWREMFRSGQMLPIQLAQSVMTGLPGISRGTGSSKSI